MCHSETKSKNPLRNFSHGEDSSVASLLQDDRKRIMSWKRAWKRRINKIKNKLPGAKLDKSTLYKRLAIGGFLGVLFLFFFMAVLFAWYAKDLPRPDRIVRKEGFATKIYDRNERLLYDVFVDEKRTPVILSQVPKFLQQATIAIEDKNFYKRKSSFDIKGYLRAAFMTIIKRQTQGASTLTQQLVKNVLLSPKRTIARKIKEFVLAVQIEKKYSKDEILQMYLNEVPYGGTAWGVQTAAETYFGKKVSELDLIESAILAGLPQKPSAYSPFGSNPEAYKQRTSDVLRRMREDGYISKMQEQKVLGDLEKVEFKGGGDFSAPHFVMYVKGILEEKYGERMVEQGGLKVYTTLDLELQEKVQEIVAEEIEKVDEPLHITNGAVLVMDPQTGEILAMIGSKDYFAEDYDGKVNVTLSLRQPGSSIKPVTYVAAFAEGYTPASMLVDVKTGFPGSLREKDYVPRNYDGKDHGPVQLRYGLGSSLNIPAVKLLALVGVKDMLKTAYDMGLTTLKPTQENVNRFGLSVTLGGGEIRLLEMVSAYSAFANTGFKAEPTVILKVEDIKGKVLEEVKPAKGRRVLSPEQAFLISHILSDNEARLITFGRNSLLNIGGRSVAVKTGTTDDMRDNWTIGWTPSVIVGVWVGNNDNSSMKRVASGISGASPIWRQSILAALAGKPIQEFSVPFGIEKIKVDKISGWPEHDGFASREEFVIKGTQPTGSDPVHVKLKLCRGQDKLAPDPLEVKGEYDEKEFIVLKVDDPIGGGLWQKGVDEWIAKQEDSKYKPPTEYCDVDEGVVVSFVKPKDKERINKNDVEIEAKVASLKEIEKVEFYVDEEKKETKSNKPYKTTLVLSDGPHEIKAKAYEKDGKTGESSVRIGVNKDWDWEEPKPSPSPSPSPSPLSSPSPTPLPS